MSLLLSTATSVVMELETSTSSSTLSQLPPLVYDAIAAKAAEKRGSALELTRAKIQLDKGKQ
jgi:hypothetical protein